MKHILGFNALLLLLMSPQCIHAATNCAAVTEIPSTECEAIVALYNSTNGDSWTDNSGWFETNTPCSWYGVTCSGRHVSELNLYDNQLSGSIPPEIAQLSNLERLDLHWNQLTGSIPSELGNLTNLECLGLYGSQLTGSIPTELGKLTNLKMLCLHYNQLTGSIPTELGNLSHLEDLSLQSNQLTGSIPSQLSNLTKLTELLLDSNQLTGSIPSELGNLSQLKLLWLYNNQLCGEIPVELKNLSNIDVPAQWGTYLKLDDNHLTASDSELRAWLNSHNPGWETTQTPCPHQASKLQFSSATYNIAEDGGQVIITVTRTDSSDGAVSVEYATSDDTATAGDDYTHTSGTLNWSNGDDADKTFTVSIADDSISEGNETFKLTLSNATGGASIGEPAVVTITDNDSTEKHGILQFSKAEFTVKENVHTAQAIITVERIGGSDGVVLVEHATSDDSAKADSDYTHTMGGVRWEDGDNDDKTFTVHIINDDEPENNETFIVSLANPIGGAQIGSPDTAIVTIRDDDSKFNCKKASGIPKKECKALVAFYDSTDGKNWEDNTGWKVTNSPCNWYGVTCRSKHVTGLALGNNNLKGSISKKLMKLKKLKELDLNDNCLKTKVSKKLKKWLDKLNPGWDDTQTNCLYQNRD